MMLDLGKINNKEELQKKNEELIKAVKEENKEKMIKLFQDEQETFEFKEIKKLCKDCNKYYRNYFITSNNLTERLNKLFKTDIIKDITYQLSDSCLVITWENSNNSTFDIDELLNLKKEEKDLIKYLEEHSI